MAKLALRFGYEVSLLETMKSSLRKFEMLKAEIRSNGSSFAQVARELDVSPASVSLVAKGYRTSKKISAALSAKVKQPFPNDSDGPVELSVGEVDA